MKILFCHDHVFYSFNNEYYSAGKLSLEQMFVYKKMGDHITIVSRSKSVDCIDLNKFKKVTGDNVDFHPFPDASNIKSLINNKKLVLAAKEIVKDYDLIIVRLPSEIGNVFSIAAKQLNKPVLAEVVACVWDNLYYYGLAKAKIYAPIAYIKMRRNVKKADFVHYVTTDFLQRRYPFNHNAITLSASDVILSPTNKHGKLWREKLRKRVDLGVIGTMDNKIKGIPLAIRALGVLRDKYNFLCHLHIIGAGDNKEIRNLAFSLGVEEQVTYVGCLPDSKLVQEYLQENIDIYIQPSYQEGMPRAVLEAMGRGVPCIVSSAGGMPEIVSKNNVHTKGNYKKLANLIFELASSPEFYNLEAEKSIHMAEQFSFDLLLEKRNAFYDLIKERLN